MDFSKEISEFKKSGTYEYAFDEGGNFVFNESSEKFNQHYLSIPLINYKYDNLKIESFYDLEFRDFIPIPLEVTSSNLNSTEFNQLTEENQQLKNQLSVLTEIANLNQTQSDILATKQIILELRIQLGQGVSERDFSDVFPYLPIIKNEK